MLAKKLCKSWVFASVAVISTILFLADVGSGVLFTNCSRRYDHGNERMIDDI